MSLDDVADDRQQLVWQYSTVIDKPDRDARYDTQWIISRKCMLVNAAARSRRFEANEGWSRFMSGVSVGNKIDREMWR